MHEVYCISSSLRMEHCVILDVKSQDIAYKVLMNVLNGKKQKHKLYIQT